MQKKYRIKSALSTAVLIHNHTGKRREGMPKLTNTKTLVEEAYRKIKHLMLQQKVAAGQKLLYRELIDWLQMSKTPIINALNRLEQEGFIVSEANRGFYVKPMDSKEIVDCCEVREALEIKALQKAMQLALPADIEILIQKAQAYEAYHNYKYDKKKMMLNADFHLHIAAISQNEVLKYLLRRNLEHVILRLRLDSYPPENMEVAAREHAGFLEAITQKNSTKGTALICRHIAQSRDNLIAGVARNEVESREAMAFFED